MANNSTTGNVTYLDTQKFNDTITTFKTGIEEYNSIKSDVEMETSKLLLTWRGKGKTQFEKDYTTIYRQLTDIADIMYELYEALIDAEAAYIEADRQHAKLMTIK